MWANEFDIEGFLRIAEARLNRYGFTHGDYSTEAAITLARLAAWANANSDGWPYWSKPSRAAARLQDTLFAWERAYRKGEESRISKAELTKAYTPIKAFLTRQGVAHDLIIVTDAREYVAS